MIEKQFRRLNLYKRLRLVSFEKHCHLAPVLGVSKSIGQGTNFWDENVYITDKISHSQLERVQSLNKKETMKHRY